MEKLENKSGADPVAAATIQLLERYRNLLRPVPDFCNDIEGCSRDHLIWMCSTGIEHATSWPIDKLSRWLGFVQGILTVRGILTVAGEREFSRPLFHAAYAKHGVQAPESMGRATSIEDHS